VLLDRFVDSSLAYQGAGRELGIDAVAAINSFAHARPDADRDVAAGAPDRRRSRTSRRPPSPTASSVKRQPFFARIDAAIAPSPAARPSACACSTLR